LLIEVNFYGILLQTVMFMLIFKRKKVLSACIMCILMNLSLCR